MKRVALSAMLSLAMVAVAAAQTSPTTGSSDQSTGATATTAPESKSNKNEAGKEAKLTGCVQSQGTGYALVDKKHPNGVQLLSAEDLKAHVGHKVEVKGTWEAASASSSASTGTTPSASGTTSTGTSDTSASASGSSAGTGSSSASSLPQSDQGANQAIRVSEIKMKSDKCESPSGSNKY